MQSFHAPITPSKPSTDSPAFWPRDPEEQNTQSPSPACLCQRWRLSGSPFQRNGTKGAKRGRARTLVRDTCTDTIHKKQCMCSNGALGAVLFLPSPPSFLPPFPHRNMPARSSKKDGSRMPGPAPEEDQHKQTARAHTKKRRRKKQAETQREIKIKSKRRPMMLQVV